MVSKKLIKSAAVLLAAFSLSSVVVPPLTTHAYEILERMPGERGEWRRDEHGWYYMLNGGPDYARSGWLKDQGRWYFFDQWGYMYRDTWVQ